jgi:hypothetical protein
VVRSSISKAIRHSSLFFAVDIMKADAMQTLSMCARVCKREKRDRERVKREKGDGVGSFSSLFSLLSSLSSLYSTDGHTMATSLRRYATRPEERAQLEGLNTKLGERVRPKEEKGLSSQSPPSLSFYRLVFFFLLQT